MNRFRWCLCSTLLVLALLLDGCASGGGSGPVGKIQDEAKFAGRDADSFHMADYDYAHDYFDQMDQTKSGHLALTHNQIVGRNMWMVWTGGDDRLWDVLTWKSFGTFDLLKTISSHGNLLQFGRYNRWNYLGVVNEPCFDEATGPDPDRFNLWLDKRSPNCPPDPFEDEAKYPGVKIGARGTKFPDGKTLPIGSFYGYATGVAGLRLFPNPAFDENAERVWDAGKYYTDPSYYNRKDLVRPYRVGMACSFCHVGPNPLNPPTDPNSPRWENLSSNVGAQYFWFDRIFAWQADKSTLIYQVLQTYEPGALDTSLVSTDYIDNPRTMNAIYYLGPRVVEAQRWGHETLKAGSSANNKQFLDFPASQPNGPDVDPSLNVFFEPPVNVWTPRVLKDGADSVGVLGALNRVYLNIGLYSEEWLRHFNALFGGQKTTPIEITEARKNSGYWNATEKWTPAMADFFLHSTEPHHLADARGGSKYLNASPQVLQRGKEVFADYCGRCHSSKGPTPAPGVDPGGCSGKDYLSHCWPAYWAWTKTDDFKTKMRAIVMAPDFLDNNYLSSELRIPVTLTQTNACSPFASNAIGGSIWDNFSSETYKDLPSVGTITYYHPDTGESHQFTAPSGGRGYTRPASLVSLWSTAPFLLNNTVGKFNPSPSVDDRMTVFLDSINKMLNPEQRDKDTDANGNPTPVAIKLGNLPSKIYRTTERSYIKIPTGYLPKPLGDFLSFNKFLLGSIEDGEGLKIGPIPAGTPVGLLANLNLDPSELTLKKKLDLLSVGIRAAGESKNAQKLTDDQLRKRLSSLTDTLLKLSKCPDLIVNRGHYFGTGMLDPNEHETPLSKEDKTALIEFLKTF